MSQRHRRRSRRWAENRDIHRRSFIKAMAREERKMRGWLMEEEPDLLFRCDLPYHAFVHKKLIHNGRKP